VKPTEVLKNEHRVIEQVLDCLDAMAASCEREGRLDGEAARQAIDFFRSFADRCHHAKEENQLFPLMESRGFDAQAGPTAVMRHEHVQGRAYIAEMEGAVPGAATGNQEARDRWLRAAGAYSAMLREHIQKEDHCLFPMADQGLLATDKEELARLFEANGVATEDFTKAFNSFGVNSQVRQASARARAAKLTGTPAMMVDGKYFISTRKAGSQANMLKLADYLVVKERAARGN
jgi:hemerythrin-like domain-containing protein